MDTIILTENETEWDKWVAIIEELQKAIRSKQMTQVGQACCGSRLLCGARALLAALNCLLYVLTLVYWFFQAIHSSFCILHCLSSLLSMC